MATSPTLMPICRDSSVDNTYWYLGNPFTFLATAKDTGSQLALIRVRTKRGAEPPPHTHTREDEAYYLLSGEVTYVIGDTTVKAVPGSYVLLPRGIQHSFRIESEEMDVLMILTPAGLDEYFRHPELSEPAKGEGFPPPPADARIYARSAEILREYGVEMAPPPSASTDVHHGG